MHTCVYTAVVSCSKAVSKHYAFLAAPRLGFVTGFFFLAYRWFLRNFGSIYTAASTSTMIFVCQGVNALQWAAMPTLLDIIAISDTFHTPS
jgi:hypothetical protein